MEHIIAAISYALTFAISFILAYCWIWPRRSPYSNEWQVAFLHPNCNAGGGGERVLWMSIAAIQRAIPDAQITVYCDSSNLESDDLCRGAERVFGLSIPNPIKLVRLKSAFLTSDKYYPIMTIFFQALGMLIVGFECILRLKPDIVIDTQGLAFSYPFFWLAKVPIVAYVHYPFISREMIQNVEQGKVSINNSVTVTRFKSLQWLKLKYYQLIAKVYSICGRSVSSTMVNSNWTKSHIDALWNNSNCKVVYPPCDLSRMQNFNVENEREPIIFSLSQFRPEKNQVMQVHILKKLFELRPEWKGSIKLVMYGGCRNKADEDRAMLIQSLAKRFDLEDSIDIQLNKSHQEILQMLSLATVGIHTMVEEHFGISLVEFMASGLIVIANNSGGPKSDIIRSDEEGFLCTTVQDYAVALERVLSMPETDRKLIREKCRSSSTYRFDASMYKSQFIGIVEEYRPQASSKKLD